MHGMGGRFYLGTSGFAYDEWRKGVFYPEDLKKDDMLNYYSTQLSSVEINYTFRRFPSEKTLQNWRERAADGFVFTLKANQRITHWKKLKDVDDDVRDFLERGKLLGDRLGCVLFQCPPTLAYDAGLLESLLATLPEDTDGPAFAMEFRHDSWAAARDRLLERRVGWCVAETDDKDPRPEDLSWDPVGYLRLRKTEYTDDEMKLWADRIGPALDAGATVFTYFKHEDEGASPKMAKRLQDRAVLLAEIEATPDAREFPYYAALLRDRADRPEYRRKLAERLADGVEPRFPYTSMLSSRRTLRWRSRVEISRLPPAHTPRPPSAGSGSGSSPSTRSRSSVRVAA